MSTGIFGTLVTTPLYNGLVFLMQLFPWADLGIAVIFFTILIRCVLFPLAQKSLRTQMVAQKVQPEIDALRAQYKNDSQQQAMKIMEVYRREKINPFASIFFLGIQIPIIFGLYFMFLKSGLPVVNPDFLYSFVSGPTHASTLFLGIVDVTIKSIPIAILAGVTQFIQALLMKSVQPQAGAKGTFGADFMKGMHFQMKYIFPLIIVFISASLPASIALYWTTSNIFSIGQEYVIRKRLEEKK
ncbi:MAG: YidC/Oxa1 family membrane protein insertase [Patescibacteria group bacterium]